MKHAKFSVYHPACIWRGYDPCTEGKGNEKIPYIAPDNFLYMKSDECGGCEFLILPSHVVFPQRRFGKTVFSLLYSSKDEVYGELAKRMWKSETEGSAYLMNGSMANGLTMQEAREVRNLVKAVVSGRRIDSPENKARLGIA